MFATFYSTAPTGEQEGPTTWVEAHVRLGNELKPILEALLRRGHLQRDRVRRGDRYCGDYRSQRLAAELQCLARSFHRGDKRTFYLFEIRTKR